jgi:hypothetical protein
MTQPIRIKKEHQRQYIGNEKPPSIEMKLLMKRMIFKCFPCVCIKNYDEKLPLTPSNNLSNSNDSE